MKFVIFMSYECNFLTIFTLLDRVTTNDYEKNIYPFKYGDLFLFYCQIPKWEDIR